MIPSNAWHRLIRRVAVAAAAAGLSSVVFAAEPSRYGVIGLYEVGDAKAFDRALIAFERAIEGRGCTVRREGKILGADGDVDIDRPNRFLFLTCPDPLLRGAGSRALFGRLEAGAARVALLEGEVMMPPGRQSGARAQGRAYILKLSRYNNEDPDRRDGDLAGIRAMAASRPDRWQGEAFISVSHAVGMKTPDEAALLFYDTPAQGERFRAGNPDILKSIGGFNKRHLTDFIYYSAASNR